MKRLIKFRAWDKKENRMLDWKFLMSIGYGENKLNGSDIDDCIFNDSDFELMQFTGLKDKNGLTDIYEGDIIDKNGSVRGNIHEITKDKIYEGRTLRRPGIDIAVANMGTSAWRDTEQALLERGCQYSE